MECGDSGHGFALIVKWVYERLSSCTGYTRTHTEYPIQIPYANTLYKYPIQNFFENCRKQVKNAAKWSSTIGYSQAHSTLFWLQRAKKNLSNCCWLLEGQRWARLGLDMRLSNWVKLRQKCCQMKLKKWVGYAHAHNTLFKELQRCLSNCNS